MHNTCTGAHGNLTRNWSPFMYLMEFEFLEVRQTGYLKPQNNYGGHIFIGFSTPAPSL